MSADSLLTGKLNVINIGLPAFADDLKHNGANVTHLDWQPPKTQDPAVLRALDALEAPEVARRIDHANELAIERMNGAQPFLIDVVRAGDVIGELGEHVVLHAGPPIDWDDMCGPMRGAVAGALVYEGWADSLEVAMELAGSGAIRFAPNHHFDAVGPMTGMTTQSMPVMVVENRAYGNRAYCAINEGLGKVMRFGGNDESVIARLKWLETVLGPMMGKALRACGGIDLQNIIARGLTMGDEMHQRNVACTSLTLRELAPAMASVTSDADLLSEALAFMGGNDQFFLNIAMATGKAIMDPVRGIENCSVVSAMCRNGTNFGIRLSATDADWYSAPVEMPSGLYFPGFSEADANPDMGDSTIVETIGLGGFAMAAAPAVAGFVGAGKASEASEYTKRMWEITSSRNLKWTIPALDFAGVPTGIDVRKVVASGLPPTINTGIAHREPGIGQVGAGVVNAPMSCFEQAVVALAEAMEVTR